MRAYSVAFITATTLLFSAAAFSIDVNVRGAVKDKANAPLVGATATLVKAGFSAVTNSAGEFAITGEIPTIGTSFDVGKNHYGRLPRPVFNGSLLSFSVPASSPRVKIDVFAANGVRVATLLDRRLPEGHYRVSPFSGMLVSSKLYVINFRIGEAVSTFAAPYIEGARCRRAALAQVSETRSASSLPILVVDTLEVASCGYVVNRLPVESYTQSGIQVVMSQTSLTGAGQKSVDSLFEALVDLVGSLDTIDSAQELKSKDFASLRNGFNQILTNEDSYHPKACLGFMVSSLLALNTSASIWRMVDSLDAYFAAIDSESATPSQGKRHLMKRSLAAGGFKALGASMAAAAIKSMRLSARSAVFPRFLTLSYIQAIAENEVRPILDNILITAGRLESCNDLSLKLEIEKDTFEIDKGEIYLLDAQMRLLRAGLAAFCMYEMNIFSIGKTDYSWIDSLRKLDSKSTGVYTLSGDSLIHRHWTDNSAPASFASKIIHYNMQRPGFLTMRSANHSCIKTDLLAIPKTIKTGLAYIRAEKDEQSQDIIKISDLSNADNDLADVPGEMIDEGISPALADKFKTPETIADFVTELLSGPYRFNETIDSVTIDITINLTAILDKPVNDMRTLLPKYKWLPENEWVVRSEELSPFWPIQPGCTGFSFHSDEDSIGIPSALIDSIVASPYDPYGTTKYCYLKTTYKYRVNIDSLIDVVPAVLIDDAGKTIEWEAIEDMIDAKTFLPYFNDYTVGGLFPGMTRQKWLDLIYQ